MEILWLAILLYSLGLAVVLQFRPAIMFHPNGTWKEFGYQRSSGHTLFPFWLFAIAWAFVSYALAATITWSWTAASVAATYAANTEWTREPEESEIATEDEEDFGAISEEPVRRPRGRPRGSKNKPRPGYYVLDPTTREAGGLRRYVYYGDQPPPDEEA